MVTEFNKPQDIRKALCHVLTHLEVPGIPGDDCEGAVVLLELQQVHRLHDVADEDEVLDGAQLVDVDLRVDEGHAVQVLQEIED